MLHIRSKDKKVEESVKAAYLEFEKGPMDKYYGSRLLGIFSRMRVKKILEELGNVKGKTVLDAGCEAGYVSIEIAKKGANVIAFDICRPAIEKLKKKLIKRKELKIRPFVASIHRMPLKSNSVDFVVCSEVIEHAPRVDVALKELKRVLKKGGTIIVTFPNESSREKIYPFARLLGMNTKVVRHVTLFSYSKDEIRKKLKKLFRIKKEYSIPPIFPLTNIFVCQKV